MNVWKHNIFYFSVILNFIFTLQNEVASKPREMLL